MRCIAGRRRWNWSWSTTAKGRRPASTARPRPGGDARATTFERDDYIVDAVRAGANGFLLKNAPPEELVAGVRAVAAGDALLTEREVDVLRLLTEGLSNAEIAKTLILGEATVKTHVSNLLSKRRPAD